MSLDKVYLLGAGFSRAISKGLPMNESMPTMAKLSDAVVANKREGPLEDPGL